MPDGATTMSLTWPPVTADRSACSTSSPDCSWRRILRSRIDTTSIRPSGSQPSPDGCCGTLTISSASLPGTTDITRYV